MHGHATGVMSRLSGRRVRERDVFLRGAHFKESVRVSLGRAGVSLSNTLPYGAVQLSEISDCLTGSARRAKERSSGK